MQRYQNHTPFFVLLRLGAVFSYMLLLMAAPVYSQTPCDVVTQISYPIDVNQFVRVQDFAAPSQRHDGRFHTAEDWYGGRGNSLGQPVYAIATGRVKYASPIAWGREGGVIILEHFMPDNTVAYSAYGHVAESESVSFPEVFGCVQAGDVIGVIMAPTPAPHLHFEIRINQPDTPGPGYTWEDPVTLGWRDPEKFVSNWQGWLNPAHRWHIQTSDPRPSSAPPLQLNDGSLLYLDGATLKRATPDGRVLWRIPLANPAVAITGYQGNPILTFADGTMQQVGFEGTFEDNWRLNIALDSPALDMGDRLLFHTPENMLIATTPDRRGVLWQLDDVPPFVYGTVTGQSIGLVSAENELLVISRDGQWIDRAQLRGAASLGSRPEDGALVVYSHGGLWSVNLAGEWAYALPWAHAIPPNSGSGSAVMDANRVYAFDGQVFHAYDRDGNVLWELAVPDVSGLTQLSQHGPVILLTSTHGQLMAFGESGMLCNTLKVYGDDTSRAWHQLGEDGILRMAIGDQFLGVDWAAFTAGCG